MAISAPTTASPFAYAQAPQAQPNAFDPATQPLAPPPAETITNPLAPSTATQPTPISAPTIDQAALDQALAAYAQLQQAPPADTSQAGIAVDPSQLTQQPSATSQDPTATADPFAQQAPTAEQPQAPAEAVPA